ncbi:hypothetical protein DWB85_13930 [Seongchinamella sediminis]|uniref:Uncharacterized protein n=1 Tax=Seongchinamella sediminis TaxID=2283635 RepID=A0A3L7DUB4_9GAMM|nr:hypothetical protein [Seongchinamella sediminis]RLQ21177.1 hypothetical protein DWB85_13930 [Seongchinamella sediminis]
MTATSRRPETEIDNKALWLLALKQALIALGIATTLLTVVYSLWFFDFHPEFERFRATDAKTVIIPGRQFRPVFPGKGGVSGDSAIIQELKGDRAAIGVKRRFDAEDYPFIQINLEGLTRFTNAYIFWRLASDPEELYSLPLNRTGDGVTQVAMVYGGENYKGKVVELVVAFFDGPALGFSNNNDVPIKLESLELLPMSAGAVTRQIFEDWTNPPLWQGYSNNIVRGIHANGMVFPNLVLNLLVITSAVALVLLRFSPARKWLGNISTARTVLVIIALCWAMGDFLRWQWRIEQLRDTHQRYSGLPLEERIRNNPIRCARFPDDCRADLLPYF